MFFSFVVYSSARFEVNDLGRIDFMDGLYYCEEGKWQKRSGSLLRNG
jgi:hypothetical protein